MRAGEVLARLRRAPRLWFTFEVPVPRLEFAASGALLATLKLATDAALYGAVTGESWTLLSYLQPFAYLRFVDAPIERHWLPWAMAAWTLPFLWIGASMTVRRCLDASLRPALACLFFMPGINWIFLAVLCALPSRRQEEVASASEEHGRQRALWRSVTAGSMIGLILVVVSALLLEEYGAGLFLGAPFLLGAVSGYLYNRPVQSFAATASVTLIAVAVAGAAIAMFALEGLICLAMALPLVVLLATAGAWLGRELARIGRGATFAPMAVVLPFLLAHDVLAPPSALRQVRTAVEVNAPREVVWRHVISFPRLAPPRELVFRAGIAAPVGATIEGAGVGAVRRCEFSTGTFVEPITAWEAPDRLAFDVRSQPAPMREISPWNRVFAPHLAHALVSRRGEFRLSPLPGERTLLEGTTWYTLDMEPAAYWTLWSDSIIHMIHRRVLQHVAVLAETDH